LVNPFAPALPSVIATKAIIKSFIGKTPPMVEAAITAELAPMNSRRLVSLGFRTLM
jgi:hypothetical protein